MLIGLVIGTIVVAVGLSQSFHRRHEPEPPNSRWKLPWLILLSASGVVLAVVGPWPVVWASLVVLLLVEVGFVLAGRNPWWMQSRFDRRVSGPRAPNNALVYTGHDDPP